MPLKIAVLAFHQMQNILQTPDSYSDDYVYDGSENWDSVMFVYQNLASKQ